MASQLTADDLFTDLLPVGTISEAKLEIITQPQRYGHRFRYGNEQRHSRILGEGSTDDHKKLITIKVTGCKLAKVIVSCVTGDQPYYPHPHKLAGKHCKDGVFTGAIREAEYNFSDLRVECVMKKDFAESLDLRKSQKVDPFKTGYDSSRAEFSIVRLCFQAYSIVDRSYVALTPVVSEPVFDAKKIEKPTIFRTSCSCGPAEGGTDVMLFCSKLEKAPTFIEFTEPDGRVIASQKPEFIHNQVALSFRTPAYPTNKTEPHAVQYRLRCGIHMTGLKTFVYNPSVSKTAPQRKLKTRSRDIPPNLPSVLAFMSSSSLESSEMSVGLVQPATKKQDTTGLEDLSASLNDMSLEERHAVDLIVKRDSGNADMPETGIPQTEMLDTLMPGKGNHQTEMLDTLMPGKGDYETEMLDTLMPGKGDYETEMLDTLMPGKGNHETELLTTYMPGTEMRTSDISEVNAGTKFEVEGAVGGISEDPTVSQSGSQAVGQKQTVVLKVQGDGFFTPASDEDLANPNISLVFAERRSDGEYQIVTAPDEFLS